MTQLYEIKVKLSPGQKKSITDAYKKKETVVLRLANDSLSGFDILYVPQNIVKRLDKKRKLKQGMDIKLSKSNIRKQVGGSLLSSILTMGSRFAPTVAKTLGLSALGGLASEGASQLMKKMTGGFLIPQNKIDQLIANKNLLTMKQKKDILSALQTGSGVHIKPTKKQQTGGFLSTLLASIGIPLAINAIKKLTGQGAPQMGQPRPRPRRSQPTKGGLVMPYQPPPFYGNWPNNTIGMGTKKTKKTKTKSKKKAQGKGLILGPNSPLSGIPLLGAIF